MGDPVKNPQASWTSVTQSLGEFRTRHLTPLADSIGDRFTSMGTAVGNFKKNQLALPGDANKDTELLGARGAVATYVADTIRNTTESIITATRVFKDPDSNPPEQAAAVLRCFSGFSMLAGLAGPTGLVVGTIVSALLGMITLILDATGPARESEMAKLEGLLRDLGAEDARNEAIASHKSLKRSLEVVRSYADGSLTLGGILQIAPITGGISEHMLLKTSEWLSTENNRKREKWEEVFLAYAESEIEYISLQVTMLQKIQPGDRNHMLAYIQEYGAQLESKLEDLMDTVDECGEYWHTTSVWHYGGHVKNPWQPERTYGGWGDIDIGSVQSIAISPRNGRIWTARWGGERELLTGEPHQVHTYTNMKACTDVCLIPFADKDTDLLVVTGPGPNPHTGTALYVNEWYERRGRFLTRAELEANSKLGFSNGWWNPTIKDAGVMMARMFRDSDVAQDRVYLVRKKDGKFSLSYAPLDELKRGHRSPVTTTELCLPGQYGSDLPFRISAAKRYLYLFTRRGAWRVRHDTLMRLGLTAQTSRGIWEEITWPSGRMTSPDGGLWHETEMEWGSNGLNDLYAWSDDHLLATINSEGFMWCGHFDAGDQSKWKGFSVEYTSVLKSSSIPQGGRSLIVVAWVNGALHFRIFDANGTIVVDKNETTLVHRPEVEAFKLQLQGISPNSQTWPKDLDAKQKADLITAVTDLVGSDWRWKQIYGGAARMFKLKPASYDYARWLHEAGANLRAGRTELGMAEGA